jgi:uncharacterized membrane protein
VIDTEQRDRVEAKLLPLLPPTDLLATSGRPNILVAFLTTMGAILIGAGLISFAAVNWDGMHRFTQLTWIGGGLLLLHGLGWAVTARAPVAGHALTAGGILATGAAIGLISEMYQIQVETPVTLLLIWWTVNLPFLVLVRSTLVALILTVLFSAWGLSWVGEYLSELDDVSNSLVESSGFLTAGGLGVLLLTLGHRVRAGVGKDRAAHLAGPLRLIGMLLALVPLFVMGFEDWASYHGGDLPAALWLPPAAVGGLALLAIALPGACSRALPLLLLGMSLALALGQHLAPADVHLIANGLLLMGLPMLVALGVRHGDPIPINMSVGWFLLAVITRFFEHLSDSLGGSLAFAGSGLVFLFLGLFLEQNRRRWVASAMDAPDQEKQA